VSLHFAYNGAKDNAMNIIATRTIRAYQDAYPDAATALDAWLEVAGKAHWERYNEVLETYANADQVGSCLVFNIRGNKYRLICGVAYANRWVKGTLFVKHFLTHAEYDKIAWKRDCER
jgi:mRNA interferase HigB